MCSILKRFAVAWLFIWTTWESHPEATDATPLFAHLSNTLVTTEHFCNGKALDELHIHVKYVISEITNSMEQSPSSEASSNSASQEIPRPIWNPKVHYCVYNGPPLVPLVSQMNPVHNFPPYFPQIHSDIILPPTANSSEWSPPFRFSDQNFCIFFSSFPYFLTAWLTSSKWIGSDLISFKVYQTSTSFMWNWQR